MSVVRATALVVAYEGGADLLRCVHALLASGYAALGVLVVDNASTDGAPARVEALGDERVRVLRFDRNLGFAGAINAGIALLESEGVRDDDVYVLVNQDCVAAPAAIGALVARLVSDARIAVAGARILALDGLTVQHAGGLIRTNGLTEHLGRGHVDCGAFRAPADVEYVTGALCALRAATWRKLGPFDERYRPVYYEEVDFCVRARRAGMRVVYEPAAVAMHAEASSSGGAGAPLYLRRYHRNRIRFLAQHRLRRGSWMRTVAAEARWLAAQRRLSDVTPVLRAYLGLPFDLITRRRARPTGAVPAADARRIARAHSATHADSATRADSTPLARSTVHGDRAVRAESASRGAVSGGERRAAHGGRRGGVR